MLTKYFTLALLCTLLFLPMASCATTSITLTPAEAQRVGNLIYKNETGGNPEYLIAWNEGEAFASLGIGHFLWFPANLESRFTETFPDLLVYFQRQGVTIPEWLQNTPDFPWRDKQSFQNAKHSQKMTQLRALLENTFDHQLAFILLRLNSALPKMLETINSPSMQKQVRTQFLNLANNPAGVYALIDYVNFKGEGTSPKERYKGQGWGLLQVLQNMPVNSKKPVADFAASADFVLTRRVKNSPQADVEQRWLPGWRKRLSTYQDAACC